jgi:hypothetical protein
MKYSRLVINSFYHNLVVDQLKNGILIYNDKTGDDIQISNDFINFVFTDKDMSIKKAVRLLSRFFTYDVKFNECIFQTVEREKEYLKIKDKLCDILNIHDYSGVALFSESLAYSENQFPISEAQ